MTSHTARRLRSGAFLIGSLAALGSVALAATPAHAQADPGFLPVTGTWTRGGVDTVAWLDLATWRLVTSTEDTPPVAAVDPDPHPWAPVVGDWDGDGVDSVQMFNRQDWRLVAADRGPLAASDPSPTPWLPVAGDWDGDGKDTVLVFDQRDQSLRRLEEGPIPVERYEPDPEPWTPVAGDWDGDRIDTLSIHRDETKAPTPAPVWALVSGDWDGDGIDTTGSLHMPSGRLAVLEEQPRSAASESIASGSPAGVSDALVTGPGPCFKTNKNMHTSVHKFYYRAGGCIAIVIITWEQWTCCQITADGGSYGCGMQLKMDGFITGC